MNVLRRHSTSKKDNSIPMHDIEMVGQRSIMVFVYLTSAYHRNVLIRRNLKPEVLENNGVIYLLSKLEIIP